MEVVVLISGNGSNLQALIDNQSPLYRISLVISNKPAAFGLERAEKNAIKNHVFQKKKLQTRQEYSNLLKNFILEKAKPDLVVLAGFMLVLDICFIEAFKKVINIHPALPLQFEGLFAIKRAFEAFQAGNISHTGVMVHEVVEEVDKGKVILQQNVDILKSDSLQDLEERIHRVEHVLIVKAVHLVAESFSLNL